MASRRWRWFHASMGVVVAVVVVGGFFILIALGPSLERRGYPAFAAVFAFWLVAVTLSLRTAWHMSPRRSRRETLRRFATLRGGTFVGDFRLPRSIRDLPSFSFPWESSGATNLVTMREQDEPIMLFDRWVVDKAPYGHTRWTLVAAREMPIDAAQMIVAPHSLVPAIGDGLAEVATESEDFDRRFRIRTSDRAFASAVMDARMTEWFLGSRDEVVFETGGRWLSVSSDGSPGPDALGGIVEALELFAEHVPRVVRSLYPADPPPLGSLIDPWSRS